MKFLFIKKCTCGSGGHPRKCNKHPWSYSIHVLELNYEGLYEQIQELEERLEKIEKRFNTK